MPHDYGDDDQPGFGLREHISEGSGVDASAGFYVPGTPFIIAPYRSLAVFVKPSSGTFSVEVTWDFDGLAGGADATEKKTATLTTGETLIFRNQGVQVTNITITGDANTAYVVMPSDVDPLAPSADKANQWPFWYECLHPQHLLNAAGTMNPAVQYDPNPSLAGFHTVIDATYYRGFYAASVADGDYLIFILRLGPKGSCWAIQPILQDTAGKVQFEWGQTVWGENVPDSGPDNYGASFPDNGLPSAASLVNTGPTWYHAGGYQWNLGGTGVKISSLYGTLSQMRIMGNPGDVLNSNGTVGDFFSKDMNGGPGVWYLKMTATKHPVNVSSVLVSRITADDTWAI